MNNIKASELVEVKEWGNSLGFEASSLNFLTAKGTIGALASFTELFWPQFTKTRGCVLLDWSFDPERLDEWMIKFDDDCCTVEKVMNQLHLWDVFDPIDSAGESVLVNVLERLSRTWPAAASEQFPGRIFETFTSSDESDYGPTITIFSSPAGTRHLA